MCASRHNVPFVGSHAALPGVQRDMAIVAMCAVASLTVAHGPPTQPGRCASARPTSPAPAIVLASVLTRVEPRWPVLSDVRNAGPIVLEVTVDAAGAVADVQVLRSVPVYERAAVDAVRQWKFAPATLHGSPVPMLQFITLKLPRR